MSKPKPPYPAEYRQQIIELARAGRTPAQLSREFGPTAQSIANWVSQDGRDRGMPLPGKDGLTAAERIDAVPTDPCARDLPAGQRLIRQHQVAA